MDVHEPKAHIQSKEHNKNQGYGKISIAPGYSNIYYIIILYNDQNILLISINLKKDSNDGN